MGRITFEQEKGITNLEIFCNSREEVINFFRDYAQMMLDFDYNEEQNETVQGGTGLKILIPNQILQRLSIAPAQGEAGNNSESLLNEIRQTVYSLCQSKGITKKI